MSEDESERERGEGGYEPPEVEDLDTTEGPSVTAAGQSGAPG